MCSSDLGSAFIRAYTELHRRGYAVSYEAWQGNRLAGGLYGVKVGRFFAGESMFTRVRDAGSAALVFAARTLLAEGSQLFDLQMVTPHTARFGAEEIKRSKYLRLLHAALR